MTNIWKKCVLGDAIMLQRGHDLPSQDRNAGIYPIISSSGLTGYHDECKAKAPGVVTGRYGTIGEVFYVNCDYWPLNTTLYVKDFKGNVPRFTFYLLQCLNLKDMNSAGAVPGINRNHIHKLKVKLPPLPTQAKIANILSAYDDLIENNLKRIKLLEEMAQITYEEWFVRLRFPGYEQKRTDSKSSLPLGWSETELGKHINFVKGKKLDIIESEFTEGFVKVMLLDSLETGSFKYTLPEKHVSVSRGDLLMLMDGARSSNVFYSQEGVVGSTLAKITSQTLPSTFLYHFFNSILDSLQTNNTGAAIPHANKSYINNLKFLIPNQQMISNWQYFILPINAQIWNLKDQNEKLKEARDILLPRLMTGMIDVETLMKDAA